MAMVKCISYFIRGWKLTTGSDNLSVCVYMEIIYIHINLAKELSWVAMFKFFLLIFFIISSNNLYVYKSQFYKYFLLSISVLA